MMDDRAMRKRVQMWILLGLQVLKKNSSYRTTEWLIDDFFLIPTDSTEKKVLSSKYSSLYYLIYI